MEEGTFRLKRADFKNLGFPSYVLSPSQKLLSCILNFPSLRVPTNMHVCLISQNTKPASTPYLPAELSSFLSPLSHISKKVKISLSPHLLLKFLQSGSCSYHANKSFTKAAEVPVPRPGARITVFTLWGSLSRPVFFWRCFLFLGFCDTAVYCSFSLSLLYSVYSP